MERSKGENSHQASQILMRTYECSVDVQTKSPRDALACMGEPPFDLVKSSMDLENKESEIRSTSSESCYEKADSEPEGGTGGSVQLQESRFLNVSALKDTELLLIAGLASKCSKSVLQRMQWTLDGENPFVKFRRLPECVAALRSLCNLLSQQSVECQLPLAAIDLLSYLDIDESTRWSALCAVKLAAPTLTSFFNAICDTLLQLVEATDQKAKIALCTICGFCVSNIHLDTELKRFLDAEVEPPGWMEAVSVEVLLSEVIHSVTQNSDDELRTAAAYLLGHLSSCCQLGACLHTRHLFSFVTAHQGRPLGIAVRALWDTMFVHESTLPQPLVCEAVKLLTSSETILSEKTARRVSVFGACRWLLQISEDLPDETAETVDSVVLNLVDIYARSTDMESTQMVRSCLNDLQQSTIANATVLLLLSADRHEKGGFVKRLKPLMRYTTRQYTRNW